MRNVLITGASKGIGAATALGFAKEKANLFIHYSSDLQGAQTVAAQSQVSGSTATLIQADLGTLEGVQALQGPNQQRRVTAHRPRGTQSILKIDKVQYFAL